MNRPMQQENSQSPGHTPPEGSALSPRKKVLAVASIGGHWVQLLRITGKMHHRGCAVEYMSTHPRCVTMLEEGAKFELISDFNRKDAWKVPGALLRALKLLRRSRPDLVVSTGAAPGLVVVMAARLLGIRSVWVDSIANVEKLSMCGRIASRVASATFTQWPGLATGRVRYAGNVIGDS